MAREIAREMAREMARGRRGALLSDFARSFASASRLAASARFVRISAQSRTSA